MRVKRILHYNGDAKSIIYYIFPFIGLWMDARTNAQHINYEPEMGFKVTLIRLFQMYYTA